MPRRPREEVAGGVAHVFARGNRQQLIFLDATDRRRYLDLLGRVARRLRWRCLAYCLMDNHVHLLIETRLPNLGRGMRELHGDYAQLFNKRHDRSGHLFQGRYGAIVVRREAQLWKTIAYIARNPVEAGLCEHPEDWTWSSHGAICRGFEPDWLDHERLLSLYDALGGDRMARYLEAVASAPQRRLITASAAEPSRPR